MKCGEREQLFAYVHRLLGEGEAAEVRAHVAACQACQGIVEDFRKLDAALDEWKPREPSPWFDARVRAGVAADELAHSSRTFFGLRWNAWWAAAALLVLLIASSPLILKVRRPRQGPQTLARQESPKATVPLPAPVAQSKPGAPPEEELSLEETLLGMEDYDLLANFEVLSELPRAEKKVVN